MDFFPDLSLISEESINPDNSFDRLLASWRVTYYMSQFYMLYCLVFKNKYKAASIFLIVSYKK